MILYKPSETADELHQILKLQQQNLPTAVSTEEATIEGFVTVQHDITLLEAMHDKCPHTIAKDGDSVVGYALSMHPDFTDRIEVLKPMFAEINAVLNSSQPMPPSLRYGNYIVMGQICIDKAYRKQGIFRKLYETMRNDLIPPFSCIITEVDTKNERSLQAHYAVGFKDLRRYTAGGQEWVLIILR